MEDMIRCAKCGKDTSRFFPLCEHCGMKVEIMSDGSDKDSNGSAPGSIEGQAHAAHDALKKYALPTKKCPYCAEEILKDAIKCRYCGEKIARTPAQSGLLKAAGLFIAFIVLALMILACVFLASRLFKTDLLFIHGKGSSSLVKISDIKLPELSSAVKNDPVKIGYIKNSLALTATGMLDETDSDGKTLKYAYGTINNSGNSTVIRLQTAVYFIGKSGKIIAEQSAWPIYGAKGKPDSLKPGSSREFRIPMEAPGPDWSGRIKMRIIDIELL